MNKLNKSTNLCGGSLDSLNRHSHFVNFAQPFETFFSVIYYIFEPIKTRAPYGFVVFRIETVTDLLLYMMLETAVTHNENKTNTIRTVLFLFAFPSVGRVGSIRGESAGKVTNTTPLFNQKR